jgi:hypothetical protein
MELTITGGRPRPGRKTGVDIASACFKGKYPQLITHRVRVEPGTRSETGYLAHRPVEFILTQRGQTRDTSQGSS